MENLTRTDLKSNLYLLTAKRYIPSLLPINPEFTRPWEVKIRTRPRFNHRGYEFNATATNGLMEVGFCYGRILCFHPHARIEGELRGALGALDWLKHITRRSRGQIVLSPDAYSLITGEEACPLQLKATRDRLLARYIAARNVVIKCAGASPTLPVEERKVAA